MRKQSMCLTVILGVLCLCSVSTAQTYTRYRFNTVEITDLSGWGTAQQGGLAVLGASANTLGGSYHVQWIQNNCSVKFSWAFLQDVTQIYYSRGEMAIRFSIEPSAPGCFTNDHNPFIEFRTDDDATAPVYGPNEEFKGRFCLRAGGSCNQNPIRKFRVTSRTSARPNAFRVVLQ